MAQLEANQKSIHITKLFLSNGRVEVEFKTKKGNSFVTNSKKDSFRRNSSVTNSKVCRQYSSLIRDFRVINFHQMVFCGRASWTLNPCYIAMFSFKKRLKIENLSVFYSL